MLYRSDSRTAFGSFCLSLGGRSSLFLFSIRSRSRYDNYSKKIEIPVYALGWGRTHFRKALFCRGHSSPAVKSSVNVLGLFCFVILPFYVDGKVIFYDVTAGWRIPDDYIRVWKQNERKERTVPDRILVVVFAKLTL